jgi:hypothetical protein
MTTPDNLANRAQCKSQVPEDAGLLFQPMKAVGGPHMTLLVHLVLGNGFVLASEVA